LCDFKWNTLYIIEFLQQNTAQCEMNEDILKRASVFLHILYRQQLELISKNEYPREAQAIFEIFTILFLLLWL
jgi:hypothetical protein